MDRKRFVPRPDGHARPHRHEWETPVFEEIGVSAEVTAYMGVWEFDSD
jgi:coenzyme PQQ precursor peptide PqqA